MPTRSGSRRIFNTNVPAVDGGQLWIPLDKLREMMLQPGEATLLVTKPGFSPGRCRTRTGISKTTNSCSRISTRSLRPNRPSSSIFTSSSCCLPCWLSSIPRCFHLPEAERDRHLYCPWDDPATGGRPLYCRRFHVCRSGHPCRVPFTASRFL